MASPSRVGPRLLGIVNITEDSFSDGGQFLDPASAIAHARRLVADGADIIDLGAAASNVTAKPISAEEEIRRLDPVLTALHAEGVAVSVDSFLAETQRYAIARGVAFLNDIHGFADPGLYRELAGARCSLIVMHAVQERGRASRVALGAAAVWERMLAFFMQRIAVLTAAGITRDRLILDPGMGFFLSSRPEASLRALAGIGRLKRAFELPVLISVSRKSFLAAVSGRSDPRERAAATLAAELFAADQGVDYIRTHDPDALRDGLRVVAGIRAETDRFPNE
jgi:dihydropteroate synthase type 2